MLSLQPSRHKRRIRITKTDKVFVIFASKDKVPAANVTVFDRSKSFTVLSCCRFCGHEDKIVTKELESGDDETEVQP
jgi:hypothetical protein